MCAMLRSVGMRARVVLGYRASEYNTIGGYYILRQLNAHAWVEAWQDGAGWKAFDPSPPGEIARLHKPAGGWLLGPLRDLYEYVEFKWLDKVITYDVGQQRNVMASIDYNLDRFTKILSTIKETITAWGYLLMFFILAVIGSVVLGAVAVLVQRRRAIRQLQLESVSRRVARRLAKHLEFYLQMLRILEKAGFVKPLWQTPAAFAAQLELQNAVRFAPVVPLTDIFYEIRFGGRPLDVDRARLIHQHLETLKQTV
jgi:protein-glutamine gamma-glutamyltransferase